MRSSMSAENDNDRLYQSHSPINLSSIIYTMQATLTSNKRLFTSMMLNSLNIDDNDYQITEVRV